MDGLINVIVLTIQLHGDWSVTTLRGDADCPAVIAQLHPSFIEGATCETVELIDPAWANRSRFAPLTSPLPVPRP